MTRFICFSFLISFIFSLTACESHHPDIYVYNSEVYTTKDVSEFEVDHYKAYANSNFLVLSDESSTDSKKREQSIQSLCKSQDVTCEVLTLAQSEEQNISKIVQSYQKFNGESFFIFSPSSQATAQYVGVINMMVHNGNEQTISGILKENQMEQDQVLKDFLVKLKK